MACPVLCFENTDENGRCLDDQLSQCKKSAKDRLKLSNHSLFPTQIVESARDGPNLRVSGFFSRPLVSSKNCIQVSRSSSGWSEYYTHCTLNIPVPQTLLLNCNDVSPAPYRLASTTTHKPGADHPPAAHYNPIQPRSVHDIRCANDHRGQLVSFAMWHSFQPCPTISRSPSVLQ